MWSSVVKWNVKYFMFQWFTVELFSKYTKNVENLNYKKTKQNKKKKKKKEEEKVGSFIGEYIAGRTQTSGRKNKYQ